MKNVQNFVEVKSITLQKSVQNRVEKPACGQVVDILDRVLNKGK